MKKSLFLILLLCANLFTYAQSAEPILENGVYTCKCVKQQEGMSQSQLYLMAHTFLSDWVGPNSSSKNNIDFDDKESATIIAKGNYFLGFEKEMLYGWDVYADFTISIKCKDGRFQVFTKIPTLSFWWTAGNVPVQTIPFAELYPDYTHKGPYKLKRYSDRYVGNMNTYIQDLTNIVVSGISSIQENDDF